MARRWFVGLGLVVALAVAACEITEPEVDEKARTESGFVPQLSSSGSSSMSVPGTNAGAGGAETMLVGSATKYDGVLVEVNQSIVATHTSYCDPEVGQTGTHGPFSAHGLSISATIGGNGMTTIGGAWPGSTKEFFAAGANGDVEVHRTGISGSCSAGPGLSLSGSTSIDYEIYPLAEIDASPNVVSPGDTVAFTFSSHWDWDNPVWKYMEGDTKAKPGLHWSATQVCSSADTCDYAPSASGRMWRTGTIEGQYVQAPGPIVWVGTPPSFTLELSGSAGGSAVTRGDSMDFSVENTGTGGELYGIDLVWTFEPDSVQFYPSATSPKFAPDVVVDSAVADSVWSGTVVHPGKVIVTGTRDSVSVADTFVVSVSERPWPSPQVDLLSAYQDTQRPSSPVVTDTIWDGASFHQINDSIYQNRDFTGSHDTGVVNGGPNDGYLYVTSATYSMARAYSVNSWVDSPGDLYHGTTTTAYVAAQGHNPDNFRNNAIDHEVGSASNSHMSRQNVAGASDKSCGDYTRALERIVLSNSTDFAIALVNARNRASDAIWFLSDHQYVNGFQQPPNHVAQWDNTQPGVVNGLSDNPAGTFAAPDPVYCDVSGV